MEIREGDFLIRKVCKKFSFWLTLINRTAHYKLFLKPSSFSSDPSEGQAVRAQRTRLGEVDKGVYVSASHHPCAVDYATMPWLTRPPYQMTTNSHPLEVTAMPLDKSSPFG